MFNRNVTDTSVSGIIAAIERALRDADIVRLTRAQAEVVLSMLRQPDVCIVFDCKSDGPRFVEAEIEGESVSLKWRDRADGLSEIVIPAVRDA